MKRIDGLLENNRRWSQQVTENNPRFFADLADQQNPDYLWIGCSDSRVAANTIVGIETGGRLSHPATRKRIADALGVPVSDVVEFVADFQPTS